MLIGIDWGGTKIEGVALTEDGKELTRRREPTPRHDYNRCIQLLGALVIIQAAGGKMNDFLANNGLWNGNRLIADPEALYPTLESFFE